MAAARKIASSSWELRDFWRRGLDRSWLSSMSQSTVKHFHPQLMKALVSGAPGPAIRSAIRGRPSCGSTDVDPEEAAASFVGCLSACLGIGWRHGYRHHKLCWLAGLLHNDEHPEGMVLLCRCLSGIAGTT